jgi:hypothetical protein
MNIPLILLNKSFTITFTVLAFLASMFFVVPTVQAALPETPKTDFIIEGLPSALVICLCNRKFNSAQPRNFSRRFS